MTSEWQRIGRTDASIMRSGKLLAALTATVEAMHVVRTGLYSQDSGVCLVPAKSSIPCHRTFVRLPCVSCGRKPEEKETEIR